MKPPPKVAIHIGFTQLTALTIWGFIVALAALNYLIAPKPHYHPQKLLSTANWTLAPNGNFENDYLWPSQLPHQKSHFIRSNDISYDGAYSMKTRITIPNDAFAHITDPLPVEQNKSYTLSVYFNTRNFLAGNLYIDLADTHGIKLRAKPGQPHWQFSYTTFIADSTTVRIRLVCDGPTKPSYLGYIDCVALTPTEEFVP